MPVEQAAARAALLVELAGAAAVVAGDLEPRLGDERAPLVAVAPGLPAEGRVLRLELGDLRVEAAHNCVGLPIEQIDRARCLAVTLPSSELSLSLIRDRWEWPLLDI